MAKLCNDSNHVPFIHLLRKENRKLHRMLSNVQARNVTLENKLKLVENLVRREVPEASDGGYEKGSTWILEVDEEGVPERAHYLRAP